MDRFDGRDIWNKKNCNSWIAIVKLNKVNGIKYQNLFLILYSLGY